MKKNDDLEDDDDDDDEDVDIFQFDSWKSQGI